MACAIESEAVARVEAVSAGVVLRDPEVQRLVLLDSRIEELLAEAGGVILAEQVDEVQLAERRSVLVARRPRADEADDLAVDERGAHAEVITLRSPVRPELRHAPGRDAFERSLADQVVVGLVPALRVHATQSFRIHITDRTDDDFGLGFGAHARDSTRASGEGEIERRRCSIPTKEFADHKPLATIDPRERDLENPARDVACAPATA